MIDAAATQKNLEAIAQKIDIGDATSVDPLAQRLRDLSEAIVVDNPYHDAWAAIDVQYLIEPSLIIERFSNRLAQNRWITLLRWTRNLLILFPAIFTWIGILLAIHASNNERAATQSFFYQWQQGFHGSLGKQWEPASIVTIDFTVFILILILTLVIIWLKGRDRRKRSRQAEELHTRLAQVLGDASLCLATGRWKAPTNLVDRFDITASKLLQEMQEERQRLAELANRREKEFADLGAFTSGVVGITTEMLAAANIIKETTMRLAQDLHAFSEQYKDIPKQQQMVLLTTNNTIKLLQESLTTMGRIEGRQELQEQALTLSLKQVGEAITNIVEAASNLTGFTEKFVEQQHLFFQNLQVEREAQNKVVIRMIDATEGTAKALQEIGKSENSLRIMVYDLNKMRDTLVAFLNSMKDEIFNDMKGAAGQISKSGASLASASITIEQASQALSQVVSLLSQETAQPPAMNGDDLARSVTAKPGE